MEEGEYDDGRLNGPGKQTYVHGEVQDGNFVDDELAKGTMIFPDKEVWEGELSTDGFCRQLPAVPD